MSILFWSVESSIGRFREKGKELVIQERQYKIFYFKYKKVKSLKVSTFKVKGLLACSKPVPSVFVAD